MTIAIAVRTSTAAVFAADSKLTTQVFVGRDADGQPQFLPQTYDNATKIVQDSSGHAVALFAGEASLGKLTFMDYVESSAVPISDKLPEQEALIQGFAGGIANLRAAYYRGIQVPEDNWGTTECVVAVASPCSTEPMVWQFLFDKEQPDVQRILKAGGVWLAGAYSHAFSILYGYHSDVVSGLGQALVVDGKPVGEDPVWEALRSLKTLRPVDKLSVNVMPVQDAIDLAYFLATTEVEMERFLPGRKYCGGAIDVMVLKTAPTREILSGPGKRVRHPITGELS